MSWCAHFSIPQQTVACVTDEKMDFGQPLQAATNDVSYYCAWQPQVLWLMLPTRLGLECLCTINSFLMAIFFLQVSFSLIMAWVIICKYWTLCLSFTLFAIVLTSQAWSYCGIMFKLSYAMKPENRVMLVFLVFISATHMDLLWSQSTP